MKTNFIGLFIVTIILALLLGSCSPAPITNTRVPLTSTITITATPASTNTPTTTPTLTETPDLNKPVGTAQPDGSVTVMENGQPRKFSETSYLINGETITNWGRLLTPNGIPFFDWPGYPQFMVIRNLLSFNVLGGETMPVFAHVNKTAADINNEDMTARMSVMVYVNKYGKNPTSAEMGAFNRQLLAPDSQVSIDFYTDSPDHINHWFFSNHGVVGIISNWNNLKVVRQNIKTRMVQRFVKNSRYR